MQFLQASSERLHTFSIKNNGHSFSLPNGISIVGYRTHIGFSIHRQEFDEYGAAEDVNDAHPRARELTRGQKAGRNKSGREVRARGRADMERRKSRKEKGLRGREREGERTTVEDWGG